MTPPRPIIVRGTSNARPAITVWWLAVVCALCVVCPALGQAETLYAECRVFQRYMIDTSGLPVEFAYELVAADASAPMPEGADRTTYRWTFRRDDEDILKIPVDSETMAEGRAVYTYALRPVTSKLTDRLYYDRSGGRELEYKLEVYTLDESVSAAPIVVAIVRNPDGTKVADPGWYIKWRGNGSDEPDVPEPVTPTPEKKDPQKPSPENPEPAKPVPSKTPSSSTDKSSASGGGTSSRTNSARTTSTESEHIAQTADKSVDAPLAFVGSAGVACLVIARLIARGNRARARR
ncbi:MAG: hypothetical protein Q4B54_03325 [Coriobacteriales bacterium]|nr:hypothetical protein [Coriobacteriales bacterium]